MLSVHRSLGERDCYAAQPNPTMTLKCQKVGCENEATAHLEHLADAIVLHFCEEHMQQYFVDAGESYALPGELDQIEWCSLCGLDDLSKPNLDRTFLCPKCHRQVPDLTGLQHDVLFNSPFSVSSVRELRIIPVTSDRIGLTVVYDYSECEKMIELLEKLRFILNNHIRVSFADSKHIDSLIESHF